ncbi:MAG: hypothetical protein AAF517_18885 [Planctomycetota bacterium]
MHARVIVFCLCLSSLGALSSCSPDQAPAEDYEKLMRNVQNAELATAYDNMLPASYRKGVDDAVTKAQTLIKQPEYDRAKAVLKKMGMQVAPILQQVAAQNKDIEPLSKLMGDLPAALGLDDYASFSKLDARGVLMKLQNGLGKTLIQLAQKQNKLGDFDVELTDNDGKKAVVVVTQKDTDGKVLSKDRIDLEKIEEVWIPSEMARDWKSTMRKVNDRIDQLSAAVAKDPQFLAKQLEAIEKTIDEIPPGALVGQIAQLLSGAQPGAAAPGTPAPGTLPTPGGLPPLPKKP